jgi:hypothetical protein
VAQLATVVSLTTCTVSLAPAARTKVLLSLPTQFSDWVPTVPVIEQDAGPLWLAIDQLTPDPLGPPGSESVTRVPVEAPIPLLLSVIVKPIGEPASTEVASAVLVIVRFGQFTVSEALAEPEPGTLLPLL